MSSYRRSRSLQRTSPSTTRCRPATHWNRLANRYLPTPTNGVSSVNFPSPRLRALTFRPRLVLPLKTQSQWRDWAHCTYLTIGSRRGRISVGLALNIIQAAPVANPGQRLALFVGITFQFP